MHDWCVGRFQAMGGPCEVLVDGEDIEEASRLCAIARAEAERIEAKFSRYRPDTMVGRINRSGGHPITVDEETALLIDYATVCWETSEGLFDITSGALRRIWKFDGGTTVPSEEEVRKVLAHVGWHRVTWGSRTIALPPGMEIDLGGLGKEYAVDRAARLLTVQTGRAFLVNFGGDLAASGPRRAGRPWAVGIDDPERTGRDTTARIDLAQGALATSGDARRFVLHEGRRLGHILDPRTGWPVADAPHAVTVLERTCLEAGTLATLAMLHGAGARAFLEEQGVEFRIQ